MNDHHYILMSGRCVDIVAIGVAHMNLMLIFIGYNLQEDDVWPDWWDWRGSKKTMWMWEVGYWDGFSFPPIAEVRSYVFHTSRMLKKLNRQANRDWHKHWKIVSWHCQATSQDARSDLENLYFPLFFRPAPPRGPFPEALSFKSFNACKDKKFRYQKHQIMTMAPSYHLNPRFAITHNQK